MLRRARSDSVEPAQVETDGSVVRASLLNMDLDTPSYYVTWNFFMTMDLALLELVNFRL